MGSHCPEHAYLRICSALKKRKPRMQSMRGLNKLSQPVSRVLSWTVIRLGLQSLAGSSNLPVPSAGRACREPIWSCFGWSLPCHKLLPAARCALTAPFHPYLCLRISHRRFALCCTGRRLAPPRRYLAPCPVKPGLSSPCLRRQRLSGQLAAHSNGSTEQCLPTTKLIGEA